MKKAFTLIVLLIVVAVLVTLMGLMFKLGAIGKDSYRRTWTISRMQKLENCLSGYNAAFGSYPPVKLHGSRSINFVVDHKDKDYGHGIQTDDRSDVDWNNEAKAWKQVKAACLAQPVACRFPFPDDESYRKYIRGISDEMQRRANSKNSRFRKFQEAKRNGKEYKFNSGNETPGNIPNDESSWRKVQLFKFGVMSFLLPRYLVMMNGNEAFLTYAQWDASNPELPKDPYSGDNDLSWNEVRSLIRAEGKDTKRYQADFAKVANIPSQSVCARWMPNLAGVCYANHDYNLFGINIREPYTGELSVDNYGIEVFSASGGTDQQYVLDVITMKDGWANDFYYYSPSPYQRYILWSGGPNGKTFPPWLTRGSIKNATAQKRISEWIKDDIIHMSN